MPIRGNELKFITLRAFGTSTSIQVVGPTSAANDEMPFFRNSLHLPAFAAHIQIPSQCFQVMDLVRPTIPWLICELVLHRITPHGPDQDCIGRCALVRVSLSWDDPAAGQCKAAMRCCCKSLRAMGVLKLPAGIPIRATLHVDGRPAIGIDFFLPPRLTNGSSSEPCPTTSDTSNARDEPC